MAREQSVVVTGVRTALGIAGVLALVIGILILVWPSKTAMVVAAIIAIYAIVAGAVNVLMAVFSKTAGGWWRIGHAVLGALFIIAGIVALSNLSLAATTLATFLGALVGIMWIVEGVVALTAIGGGPSRWWTIAYAVLSIVAGVLILFAPLWGAFVLWWVMGISLVVLGIMQIARAWRLRASR